MTSPTKKKKAKPALKIKDLKPAKSVKAGAAKGMYTASNYCISGA